MIPTPMILDRHPDRDFGRRAIGYWRLSVATHLPDPRDHVDPSWDAGERETVIDYLKQGEEVAYWRGWSTCRFCGKPNGSTCLGDDAYVWPSGFAHYLEEHGVRPPEEFVRHVLARVSP